MIDKHLTPDECGNLRDMVPHTHACTPCPACQGTGKQQPAPLCDGCVHYHEPTCDPDCASYPPQQPVTLYGPAKQAYPGGPVYQVGSGNATDTPEQPTHSQHITDAAKMDRTDPHDPAQPEQPTPFAWADGVDLTGGLVEWLPSDDPANGIICECLGRGGSKDLWLIMDANCTHHYVHASLLRPAPHDWRVNDTARVVSSSLVKLARGRDGIVTEVRANVCRVQFSNGDAITTYKDRLLYTPPAPEPAPPHPHTWPCDGCHRNVQLRYITPNGAALCGACWMQGGAK